MRAALTEQHAQVAGCFTQTGGARRPVSVMVSSPLYVSPGAAYFPKHAGAPFMAAFEHCIREALGRWSLPRMVGGYEAVWLRFLFLPLDAEVPASPTRSPLFEQEGTRVLLEVTQRDPYERPERPQPTDVLPAHTVPAFEAKRMTRPQELGKPPKIIYSDQALALRVEGVMVLRCTLTELGVVENCRILKPLPFMERNVLASLYARRYTPVLFDGKPVTVDYTFTIHLKGIRR